MEHLSNAFNGTQNQVLAHTIEALHNNASYEDVLLLPAVLLGSLYVLNKGNLWPRKDPFAYKKFERPQQSLQFKSAVTQLKRTWNVSEKLQDINADWVIFWGSQSGTAEGLAHRLSKAFQQRFRLHALVADLSDYDPATIASIPEAKLAIFIMATYGEGDPSDNAQEFLSWATSSQNVSLHHLSYAAFGYGNSSYKYFNKTVEDTVAALNALGAKTVRDVPVGKGNEATRSTQEDFIDWEEKLFAALVAQLSLEEHEAEYEPDVKVIEDISLSADKPHLEHTPHQKPSSSKTAATHSAIGYLPIVAKREIAQYGAEQGRTCLHLEVDLSFHPEIKYKTGDHIAVWPVNEVKEVDMLLQTLGLGPKRDTPIRIQSSSDDEEIKVPSPTTIQALFSHYLEIASPLSRDAVLLLAKFASTDRAREILESIGKDRDTYASFLQQHHITLARIMQHTLFIDPSATWTSLPLSFVIDALPAMQPRLYSISSSRIMSPRRISLTVAVKPTKVAQNAEANIEGLASFHLSRRRIALQEMDETLPASSSVHVQIRQSTFKLPVSSTVPLVLVAAGTGIAPFRAFLQERARLVTIGREIGNILVFFGCQDEHDYLYKDELTELVKGPLAGKAEIVTAFSRKGATKTYVQDQVEARKSDVARLLLDEDAGFYICGAATMSKQVGEVIREMVKGKKAWSDDEAEKWRQERRRSKRWFEDVWG